MTDELKLLAQRADNWLREAALPLWATHGFDATDGLFEEQLTYSGKPVRNVPRRVMVQCRQIAVFASAHVSGRFQDGGNISIATMLRVIEQYHGADGKPGWVFSIDREGQPVENKRDLYAHAFVLFALAYVIRIKQNWIFDAAVEATLSFLDTVLVDSRNGGFWDCLPRSDGLRRQNPHMHLFEALIALYEATKRADILARGRALRDLAIGRFLDLETGALREYFKDDWRVHPAPGSGIVEPGHLFEWAWLLRRWQAVTGEDQSLPVAALLRLAVGCGLEPARGRIVDEIGEDGRIRNASSRSWPHAEALKALTTEAIFAAGAPDPVVAQIATRLLNFYCRSELGGGWIDHLDEADRPISKVMPASSLYHLYFGLTSVVDLVRRGNELEHSNKASILGV